MYQKIRGRGAGRLTTLLLSAVIMLFCLSITAFAEVTYYSTWKEYKEAKGMTAATWNDVADAEDELMEAAYKLYEEGDADEAFLAARQTYYGYYETCGFERNVMGFISGARVSQTELQFRALRNVPKNGGALEEFRTEIEKLSAILHEDADKLDGKSSDSKEESSDTADDSGSTAAVALEGGGGNWGITFAACFGIILREGFEAILVVGAIIAYLVKSGNKDKLKFVYAGCVLAIIASFVCAWLLDVLMFANTENQEIIEGVTALIAVVVLFYVSNWMVSKAESEAWTKYIDSQVKVSAASGSVFTLGFTAFLAVFREGAEVILFYQPLMNDESTTSAVWSGFGLGCVALVIVFIIIRFFSVKLPIKPFFLGTSILMFIMSISFLGAGIKELIEGDVITYTSPDWLSAIIPTNDVFDVLGIYPCYETLIPQLILILITLLIFVMTGFKDKNKTEAGLLAIVFGSFGMHKFYIGKYGQGILYAVFCWSFIPGLVGICEGIHYLTRTDEQFELILDPKAAKPEKKKAAPEQKNEQPAETEEKRESAPEKKKTPQGSPKKGKPAKAK